ncbi:MAG: hypothetical protein ACKO2Q_03400, partial [Actinomycetota bacterium]
MERHIRHQFTNVVNHVVVVILFDPRIRIDDLTGMVVEKCPRIGLLCADRIVAEYNTLATRTVTALSQLTAPHIAERVVGDCIRGVLRSTVQVLVDIRHNFRDCKVGGVSGLQSVHVRFRELAGIDLEQIVVRCFDIASLLGGQL